MTTVADPSGRAWGLAVHPRPWLLWTPHFRDLRFENDDPGGVVYHDLFDLFFSLIIGFLWRKLLWLPFALMLFLVEIAVVVLLIPVALLMSALGLRRHRVVATAHDGDARHEITKRGVFAVLNARRGLARSLAGT